MPKIEYNIKISVNEGMVMSASELIEEYFIGIPLKTPNGDTIRVEQIKSFIKAAQTQLEDRFDLKLVKQEITESLPFIRRDFQSWGYIEVSYPVNKPTKLYGYLNDVMQIAYPPQWLSAKTSGDAKGYQSRMYIVPGNNAPTSNSVVFAGIIPNLGLVGFNMIPDYWRVSYITGFDKVPQNITQVIGKLASIPMFAILGDVLFGLGLSSKSISIDGLSQSLSSPVSGGNSLFTARVKELTRQLEFEMKILDGVYKDYNFTVA